MTHAFDTKRGRHLFFVEKNKSSFLSHSPSSAYSRRVGVSYKQKYVHKVLVNRLVKLAREKVWLG